jgi:hypothetical protein
MAKLKNSDELTPKEAEKVALAAFIKDRLDPASPTPEAEQLVGIMQQALAANIITPGLYAPQERTYNKVWNEIGRRKIGGYAPELLYTNDKDASVFAFGWSVGAVTPIHNHPPVPEGKTYKCGLIVAQGEIKETTYTANDPAQEKTKALLKTGSVSLDNFGDASDNHVHRLKVRKDAAQPAVTIHIYPLGPEDKRCKDFFAKAAKPVATSRL